MVYLFILLATLYYIIVFLVGRNWNADENEWVLQKISDLDFATIIILARNEEKHIETCLNSVANQSIPHHHYEIILVDDFSSDQTVQLAQNLNIQNLKIIQLDQLPNFKPNQPNKKMGLSFAVQQAKGKIILTTDADCIVTKNWIQSVLSYKQSNQLKFVAAPVQFISNQSLLGHFQILDFCIMMAFTAMGLEKKWYFMANAANMCFEKEDFIQFNNYKSNQLASGDDIFLLQKIRKQYPNKIGFLKNTAAIVKTQPETTVKSFFQQRLRWGTKNGQVDDLGQKLVLGFVFLFNTALLIGFISYFWLSPKSQSILTYSLLLKTLFDYLLLRKITTFFSSKSSLIYFFPIFFLHIIYVSVMGVLSLFVKKYVWKGRVTK